MIAVERAGKWIYTKLAADATLSTAVGGRIYRDLAPQNSAVPSVVFSPMSAVDILANGAHYAGDNELWQVRAVGQGESPYGLKAIADRIYAALHGVTGAVDDMTVTACVRESTLPIAPEVDQGIRYVFACQIFRIWIRPT